MRNTLLDFTGRGRRRAPRVRPKNFGGSPQGRMAPDDGADPYGRSLTIDSLGPTVPQRNSGSGETGGGAMAILRPFEICTPEEVLYLLDLAREHLGHVRLTCNEDPEGRLKILLEADTPELSRFLAYMLDRERCGTHDRREGGSACVSP